MKKFPWKWLGFFLFILCAIREWRRGYFKALRSFGSSFSYRPYLKIIGVFTFFTLLTLFFVDLKGSQTIRSLHDPFFVHLNSFARLLGRKSNPWIFIATLYFLFVWIKKNRWAQILFGSLISNALTVGATSLMKFTFLRARPETDLGHLSFFHLKGLLPHGNNYLSFCSGDVASVAGICAFLFYIFQKSAWKWLFVLLPVLNAFSRIYLNNHWPSDTLFAIGLGFTFGYLVYQYDLHLTQKHPELCQNS